MREEHVEENRGYSGFLLVTRKKWSQAFLCRTADDVSSGGQSTHAVFCLMASAKVDPIICLWGDMKTGRMFSSCSALSSGLNSCIYIWH